MAGFHGGQVGERGLGEPCNLRLLDGARGSLAKESGSWSVDSWVSFPPRAREGPILAP